MSTNENEAFMNEAHPAPEESAKNSKAANVAGLFTNKKTRSVILFTLGIIFAAGVLIAFSFNSQQNIKKIPEGLKGVDAGMVPNSMQTDGVAKDSPRFAALSRNADNEKVKEVEKKGGSFEPAATNNYTYQQTGNAASSAAAINQGYMPSIQSYNKAGGTVPTGAGTPQNQPQGVVLTPVERAEQESNAARLTAALAAATRNIALWDAPRGAKMMVAESKDEGLGASQANPLGKSSKIDKGEGITSVLTKKAPIKLLSAGFMSPLQITVALNSAEPGTPVVGTLLSGDFKGSVLTGKFTKNNDDTLRAEFTSMTVMPYNVSVSVNAFTLNPDDKLKQGIVTDIDQHLFLKYFLKPSAQAIAAVGQALATPQTTVNIGTGSTISTSTPLSGRDITGVGLGAAAKQYSQDITDQDTSTTVMVRALTIVGVVFVKDVEYVATN